MSRLTQGHIIALPVRDYHPLRSSFPDWFRLSLICHWPGPRSLATTNGVSVDVLSSGYLDVSVPRVRLKPPMYSGVSYLQLITENPKPPSLKSEDLRDDDLRVSAIEGGFPHSEIYGSKPLRGSP